MKPIKPLDVARFLNGEITDRQEWLRIAEAIETDPKVQRWYDQLDLDNLFPDEDFAESPDEQSAELAAQIARSTLWRLQTEQPLSKLLSEIESLGGQLVRQQGSEQDTLDCTLRRIGDDPPTFEMTVPDWPQGFKPLGVLLGRFAHVERKPAVKTFFLRQDVIKFADSSRVDSQHVASGAHGLAAHTTSSEPVGDIQFGFDERQNRLLVTTTVPEDRDGDVLVAELRYTDSGGVQQTQRRAVPLNRRLKDGRWKGSAGFAPLGDLGSREVSISVGSISNEDLDLLPSSAVVPFLAQQRFLSMPVEESENGFIFRARWDDQQQAATDPETCWCIQVALPGKEGPADV